MDIEYSPDLVSELKKNELQKIYILAGERGLGKHKTMYTAEKVFQADATNVNILSIHPDEFCFALWPIEEALRRSASDIPMPSSTAKDGLNYVEQLTRSILTLCKGSKRTLIFLYRIHAFSDDLWAFIIRLFRLLLDPYRVLNVCFCCCLHTNDNFQADSGEALRNSEQIIEVFSRYAQNTCYLHFRPWPRMVLHQFLWQDLFQNKLCISPGQENLLLDAIMGNPATLICLTERLKARELLYEEGGYYHCQDIDSSVLLSCGPVPVTEQYSRLDNPLRELLRGSSIIGVEFEAHLLSNPLEFQFVEEKLKRLLSISRIVRQKVDNLYEFESMFARLSIRDFVSKEEYTMWNSRLGDYFWRLSQRQASEGTLTESINSLKKSAFYFDEAKNHPQAIQLYDRLVVQLMAIMQYRDAVKIIYRIRSLCEANPDLRSPGSLARTWQLEGDCYRYCSDFHNSIQAYENFLEQAPLSKIERFDARCSLYVVLYESGEIHQPLKHLYALLSDLESEFQTKNEPEIPIASVLVKALSCLASIEETVCNPQHTYHFNAALDIAKRYKLKDEYYSLLRKALIVHKGISGIQLMESAREYYEGIGNQKELAKTLSNIAAELLLYGDMEQARIYYQHSFEIMRDFGSDAIYVPLIGLGDYWCLRGEFERALPLFEAAFREEYDAFSRIAILINQATAYRKLCHFDEATERLECAEQISNEGDASQYAILLPHLLINKALLCYDKGELKTAYSLFLDYIIEETPLKRRRTALAGQYIKRICLQLNIPVPNEADVVSQIASPADERFLKYGITLIRFSITE